MKKLLHSPFDIAIWHLSVKCNAWCKAMRGRNHNVHVPLFSSTKTLVWFDCWDWLGFCEVDTHICCNYMHICCCELYDNECCIIFMFKCTTFRVPLPSISLLLPSWKVVYYFCQKVHRCRLTCNIYLIKEHNIELPESPFSNHV